MHMLHILPLLMGYWKDGCFYLVLRICSHGGYLILRHNENRDITAQLTSEVCPNVATEPASNEYFAHRSANTEVWCLSVFSA